MNSIIAKILIFVAMQFGIALVDVSNQPEGYSVISGGESAHVHGIQAVPILPGGGNSLIYNGLGESSDPKTCKHPYATTTCLAWNGQGKDPNKKTCWSCGADLNAPVPECKHKHVICLTTIPPREICQDCGKEL